MEKHPHPFDDFLKEALKGHQFTPQDKAKKAFLEEASVIIPVRKGWRNWYFLPLIMIISGIIVFLAYQINTGPSLPTKALSENNLIVTDTNSTLSESSDIKPLSNINKSQETILSTTSDEISTFEITSSTRVQTSVISTGNLTPETLIANRNILVDTTPEQQISPAELITIDSYTTAANPDIIQNDSSHANTVPEAEIDSTEQDDGIDYPANQGLTNDSTVLPVKKVDLTWKFSSGIYYLPEMMYNTLEDHKFVNNFGIDAIFYKGPVSIRTGVGISISKGITTNSVDYNDYLGAYNKLDSITFSFNEELNDFEPTLFMSSEKVWDTVQKSDSADIIKRYTYLQVPLVLGFDFWQKGRFSLGVRVGTIMSVLLNSEQLTGAYDPGENQVVGINILTPDQVSINWQALGGLNATAVLSRRICIEIEPQVKYYYGSIYDNSANLKKPWSIGIRTAMVFKF